MGRLDCFAAIADIHGNRWALEAVLEDIGRRGVRDVVNLGDHLFGPLDREGTEEILLECGFPTAAGNQDREEPTEWLSSLPFQIELPGMLLFHGTPVSDSVYLLETVRAGGVTIATEQEVFERLSGVRQPLLLCGHTHIPRTVSLGGQTIVNPGSVGLQAYADETPIPHLMETGSPHARYAILERMERGWNVQHIQIPYDWDSAAAVAALNGRADWEYRLKTGRAR